MAEAKRDQNRIPTLIAVSSVDGTTPVVLYADPVTHRLYVDIPNAGAGDVVGPASAVDGNIAVFDGITGKLIKDGGAKIADFEVVANKSTSVITDGSSNTKYPSVKAVKDYADGLVTGLLDYRGAYDASGNTYPTTGGSGTAGAVLKGDMWIISVAGTLGGTAVQIGDSIIANVDTPGQTAGNWNVLNGNISYVPEDVANKSATTTLGTSDTLYPTQNAVKVYADTKIAKATNVTAINDTGIADGEIALFNLTNKDIRTSDKTIVTTLGSDDTTVPTSKAVKDVTDAKLALAGGTMSGSITLGENTGVALDPAGSADGKWSGITVTGVAGYAQTYGDLVYLDPTDSRWEQTDANSASGADGDARGILGMVVVAGAADGNACTILLHGIIRADAKFDTFTINNPIYVSETAGAVTQTQPTTADVVIRIVGSALTADELYFNPDRIWITHT